MCEDVVTFFRTVPNTSNRLLRFLDIRMMALNIKQPWICATNLRHKHEITVEMEVTILVVFLPNHTLLYRIPLMDLVEYDLRCQWALTKRQERFFTLKVEHLSNCLFSDEILNNYNRKIDMDLNI